MTPAVCRRARHFGILCIMRLIRPRISLLSLLLCAGAAVSLMAAPDGDLPGIPGLSGPATDAPIGKAPRLKVSAALDHSALQAGREARLAVVLDFADGFHAHSNKPSKPEYIATTVGSLKAD